jgi:hypothetical protein
MFLPGQRTGLFLLLLLFSLPGLAQYKIRELKRRGDKDFVFPVFSGTNKTAAKKINELLQIVFFETTTPKTPEKKLFDEHRFISEDSIFQSGYTYTSISYKVELNTPKILSVVFEVEAMGAYPTHYQQYFSFDSRNGNIYSPQSIFTENGIAIIKKTLIDKRNEEISETIEELSVDDPLRFIADSTFIFERFESCNEEAEEKNMFIKKGKILFYKHDCFPHAWRPYETNLDIVFTFKEVKKYLSDFGKKLLFTK